MSRPTAKQLAETTDRWLFKVEPEPRIENGVDVSMSVDALAALPNQTTHWDGVRNPQASGFMRDRMRVGHLGLMYYSNTKVPGVVATVLIVRQGYPDHTARDYDPTSDRVRWYMVDVRLEKRLEHYVPLWLLKLLSHPEQLTKEQRADLVYLSDEQLASVGTMPLVQPGRLSVQPVPPLAYETVLLLGSNGGFEGPHWPTNGTPSKRPKTASSTSKRPASPPRGELSKKLRASDDIPTKGVAPRRSSRAAKKQS